jgi:large subunit ribosomal protein L19
MQNGIITSSVNMEERKNLGISSGDTVRVWQKIEEKGKSRLQAFEGLILAVKHGSEAGGTFTVRKVASGVGVEKVYPLYSPLIDRIEIVKRVKVRKSKLYYIRDKVAREARRQLRRMLLVNISTKSETEQASDAAAAVDAAKKAEADALAAIAAAEAAAVAAEAAVMKEEMSSSSESEMQSSTPVEAAPEVAEEALVEVSADKAETKSE